MRNRWEDKRDVAVDELVTITESQLRSLKRGARLGLISIFFALAAMGVAGWTWFQGTNPGSEIAAASDQPRPAAAAPAAASTDVTPASPAASSSSSAVAPAPAPPTPSASAPTSVAPVATPRATGKAAYASASRRSSRRAHASRSVGTAKYGVVAAVRDSTASH